MSVETVLDLSDFDRGTACALFNLVTSAWRFALAGMLDAMRDYREGPALDDMRRWLEGLEASIGASSKSALVVNSNTPPLVCLRTSECLRHWLAIYRAEAEEDGSLTSGQVTRLRDFSDKLLKPG